MTRYKSKEAYDNNLAYIKEFNKVSYKQVPFKLNKNNDVEMIEWLSSKDNVQGYLKRLIYNDMIKNKAK